MKRRRAAIAGLALVATSCTGVRITVGDDNGVSGTGQALSYRVRVQQVRRGEGLTQPIDRTVSLEARITQRSLGTGAIGFTIEKVDARGEATQVRAAEALQGRVLTVSVGPDGAQRISLGIAGDADMNAIDVALLFQLISPVLPGAGSAPPVRSLRNLSAPWSDGISLDVEHRRAGKRWTRWVVADVIETDASGTVTFLLPIARESAPSSSSGSQTHIVDEVFESLYGVAEQGGPAGALAASIAAIPLSIAAPFLALADALGGLFGGGGSSAPRRATIPLSGPIHLSATTATGGSDHRELHTTGSGSMRLEGKLPAMSGDAADLSERPLLLTADWTYSKDLVKPWPFGALIPAVALLLANVVGLVIVFRRRRSAVSAPGV
ncbi:MAG: hypothetical protein ACRDJ1_13420 [Actinomycetota bacterium]